MKVVVDWPVYICKGCQAEQVASGASYFRETDGTITRQSFGPAAGWFVQRVYLEPKAGEDHGTYADVALCTACLGRPYLRGT